MTITRIIDGKPVEITLTFNEIWEAHRAWEHHADTETVSEIADEIAEDDGLEPFTDEEISEVVTDLREAMDNSFDIWGGDDIRQFVEDRLLECRE